MEDHFKHKTESNITLSQLMLPSHANFNGKVHGGYILEVMDQIAFACASKHSENYCVTASVNTVNFLRPVEVGELLTLKASINFVGNSSMVVGIRVEAEDIRNADNKVKHCNSSYFTMVAMDEHGNKAKVPGLILENNDDIRRFSKSIARQRMEKERHREYSEEDFESSKYVNKIKSYNVKLIKSKAK
ncbi:acyl-CoA thioesterase [Winogradskyella forsetii]|uniref:acyl-CoA thioesterase n=1 Tax=Winogradskyella forsetii TaxID=2686077 RepID=UPI0015C758D1|nr:acyl-CoA thioesterase [Winogradskyella forsetii]